MKLRVISIVSLLALVAAPAAAQVLEGNYLYRVSTVRAAPGTFSDLLDWFDALEASGYYEESGESPPFIMRHSQGDQWDLMIISPMESFTAFYDEEAANKRQDAAGARADLIAPVDAMLAFLEENYAMGPPPPAIEEAYANNSLYHIEMFEALPGKIGELLQQRRMENNYLQAIGLTTNMIFRRVGGSDVDVFTIGFHKDLAAFAAPSPASDEEREAAAVDAGFENRAAISFYLRSLISGHHDTLAVKVE